MRARPLLCKADIRFRWDPLTEPLPMGTSEEEGQELTHWSCLTFFPSFCSLGYLQIRNQINIYLQSCPKWLLKLDLDLSCRQVCHGKKSLAMSLQDTLEHEQDATRARIPVFLPDMFVSFLARTPRVNPLYEKVKMESEAWINRFVRCDVGMTWEDSLRNAGNAISMSVWSGKYPEPTFRSFARSWRQRPDQWSYEHCLIGATG